VSKPKKEKAAPAVLEPQGIVLYTDGGARPTNPGFAGYGFHGYVYNNEPAKRGTGLGHWCVTADGYVDKRTGAKEIAQVTPLNYIDGFGTVPGIVSNNVAEVAAATWAIEYAKQQGVKAIRVITDSKGTVEAASKWLPKWEQQGWIKSDGRPVANQEYLKLLAEAMRSARDSGMTVDFQWVKGHNGDLGNETSDQLATMGVLRSMSANGKLDHHVVEKQEVDKYWTRRPDKHPLMVQRATYFMTDPSTLVPGEYYMGDHGKLDEDIGMPAADSHYSYVVLDTPDDTVEMLRRHVCTLRPRNVSVCYLHMPKVYSREAHAGLVKYGSDCVYSSTRNPLNLQYLDGDPVVREFNPPILAWRAIEEIGRLKDIDDGIRAGDAKYHVQDVTHEFYTTDAKGKTELDSQFGPGLNTIKLPVTHSTTGVSSVAEIQLGHDAPARNTLKHVESMNPKIQLVCWHESPQHLRYATVLTVDGGRALYCGVHTNNLWVKKPS
jgi:ribonuclease HI